MGSASSLLTLDGADLDMDFQDKNNINVVVRLEISIVYYSDSNV